MDFWFNLIKAKKNGSLAGQFVDCITRLVGKEMKHKPWNRGEDFDKYCKDNDVKNEMFLYKDERFGCFPKACGVVLYMRETVNDFLSSHPDIDNRLACIVRDVYEQEYLVLVLAVVAAFGLQLVEPFHSKTLSKTSKLCQTSSRSCIAKWERTLTRLSLTLKCLGVLKFHKICLIQ